MCSFYLIVSLSVFLGAVVNAVDERDFGKGIFSENRLPKDVLPTSYNLKLTPFLRAEDGEKQYQFDGDVSITITAQKAGVKNFALHSKYLNYSLMEYWDNTNPNNKSQLRSTHIDPETNIFSINLDSSLEMNKDYTFHFIYSGYMKNDMLGFYRSSYVDDNNNVKWLGSTQFQKDFARRAFPCFDEPNFKATFDLIIIRHKTFNTVSNTRLMYSKKIDDETYMDVYERTPSMSVYLLAFLVSDFMERENGDFSIVTRPEYYDQTSYSFEIGQELLKNFDEYFQLPYYRLGIDKMHMAAIPDFSPGAMENWGLVTFRERGLLYEYGCTTSSDQQSITTTISHELAHMWFGNLVTCEWWTYTWLNEGFATYFGYIMTGKIYPEWEMESQFVVEQLQTVFGVDSTNKTSPMSGTAVNDMIGSISYNKAGSIIRMVKHAMGEESFQNSLQDYLTDFKFGNTIPEDLSTHWKNHWPAESKLYAENLFESFTTQVGYPVLYIDVAEDGNSMEISQKRFLLDVNDGSDPNLLYTIPLTFTTDKERNFNATKPTIYLEASTSPISVNLPQVNWVIANIQQTGYYRVNYNKRNWDRIQHVLKESNWGNIHDLNRAQFIDDLFNLARSGHIAYELALNCLEYLTTETQYLPWTAAFKGYDFLTIRLGTSEKENFQKYIFYQTRQVFKYLGFDEKKTDSRLDVLNRNQVLSWLCKYGDQNCISKSLSLFQYITNSSVPIDIRSVVYCTAMREQTDKEFEILFKKFQNEKIATEKTLIMKALGCVKDSKLIERYFKIIMSDDIRLQDKSSALRALYTQNLENVSPVFKLVTDNCDQLAISLGSYSAVASEIIEISSRFTTESQINSLEEFNVANRHKFGTSATILENAIKTAEDNLLWSKTHLEPVIKYLEARSKNGAMKSNISIKFVVLVIFLRLHYLC